MNYHYCKVGNMSYAAYGRNWCLLSILHMLKSTFLLDCVLSYPIASSDQVIGDIQLYI